MTLNQWAPWVLTAGTAVQPWLIGNHNRSGWLVTIAVSVGAMAYNTATAQYGFLPMSVVVITAAVRNYVKWGREAALKEDSPPSRAG